MRIGVLTRYLCTCYVTCYMHGVQCTSMYVRVIVIKVLRSRVFALLQLFISVWFFVTHQSCTFLQGLLCMWNLSSGKLSTDKAENSIDVEVNFLG